jgi:ATP-dependent Clp protease ATP-binding subunit ClpB
MMTEVKAEAARHFRPEFLNRVDDLVVFHSLVPEQLKAIVDIQMEQLRARLSERRITLELSDDARALLAEKGFDPMYGARPLKRVIQKELENPLGKAILKQEVREGMALLVEAKEGGLTFRDLAEVAA